MLVGAILAMLSSTPASMPAPMPSKDATLVIQVAKKATCQRPCRGTLRAAFNACLAACAKEDKDKATKKKPNPNLRLVCVWVGTAPFCKGRCGPNTVEKARSETGDGKPCVTGTKAYCCQKVFSP
jgi:hypothetical protein